MRLALVAVALVVAFRPTAAGLGKECGSNEDCPSGATCVAGDSVQAVQRCVAGTPCGGNRMGSCPGDTTSGQLTCVWLPDDAKCGQAQAGCKEIDNRWGIYKCISMSRCDQYFSGRCSQQCNADGKQCNGRGNCQLISESVSEPKFTCSCDNGWNGTQCNNVENDSCLSDVGQCGEHGTCKDSKCTCTGGYTGKQCEIAPPNVSGAGSGNNQNKPSTNPTTASMTSSSKNSGTTSKEKSKNNGALATIIAVIAALVLIATVIFVVYARKRRQQDAAAEGFQRATSVDGLPVGPTTPKQRIVTM